MKSKFATIIMGIIILLIIGVIGIFGMIFYQEIIGLEVATEPENFQTVFSDKTDTVDTNLETPQIIKNPLEDIQDGNTQISQVDYSNVNVDKYFYNQLEEYSKTFYKAFESNKENLKTGTYKIELGESFSSLLDTANGQEELGKYYQSAIEAYTYDNPDVFYLSPNKMYLNIETTTIRNTNTYNVYINSENESNYLTDEYSSKVQIDNAIEAIQEIKNSVLANRTGNTYHDIKMVHDYLVDNVEYDTSLSKPNIYNLYGALVNRIAVCEGYARAFKYMMDELEIPCVLVIGKGTNSQGQTENHAWNYVQVNGAWYAVDATWDDPVVSGGGRVSEASRYKYFLKGSNSFNQDHIPSGQFTPNGKFFTYPSLSANNP